MNGIKEYAAGVDIGGTNSAYGLVDRSGAIVAEGSVRTAEYDTPEALFGDICRGIASLLESLPGEKRLAGIGIGAPNVNYFRQSIVDAANLKWKGEIPITRMFLAHFPGLPVISTNDAKAAAVGEMVYGGARGMKDFIMITLGTGMGSGFVANGELIYGHDSFAGELGHTIVSINGRQCGCGRKGCLETYCSASGIKRTVFKLLADHTGPSQFRGVSFDDLSAKAITQAALDGDPLAVEAFEHTGMYLGRALANAVAVMSPEAIFLFGGLAMAGRHLMEPAKRHMEENLLYNFKHKVSILPSELMDKNAAILGSSALVWQRIGL